jgi:hypothetical protein
VGQFSPLLIHHFTPEVGITIMFEVAFTIATQWSKEAGNVSNTIRVSLVMFGTVEMFFVQFFNNNTVVGIFNVMFAVAFITAAGAREIAVINCRHSITYVIEEMK